jgi:hypothetical protein
MWRGVPQTFLVSGTISAADLRWSALRDEEEEVRRQDAHLAPGMKSRHVPSPIYVVRP